jgi:hypothetical protein
MPSVLGDATSPPPPPPVRRLRTFLLGHRVCVRACGGGKQRRCTFGEVCDLIVDDRDLLHIAERVKRGPQLLRRHLHWHLRVQATVTKAVRKAGALQYGVLRLGARRER